MRICIIDDEPGVTENLVLYLEGESHQVEVLNYVENEEHLTTTLSKYDPDGVILDYDMAPLGVTLHKWIRDWSADVRTVFYTKYASSPFHRQKMLEAGVSENEILPKVEAADDVTRLLRVLRS